MLENSDFIITPNARLYVRSILPKTTNKAIIFFSSRTLCVESSMGISMGSVSYADFLADAGINVFLVDLRSYGSSTPISVTEPYSYDDYYQDIIASIDYVKNILGNDVEISLMGFSITGGLVVTFANKFPDMVNGIVCLNPSWRRLPTDPPKVVTFFKNTMTETFTAVNFESIKERLASAQLPNKDFREPLWESEAFDVISKQQSNFSDGIWKVNKFLYMDRYYKDAEPLARYNAKTLIVSSEYDTENPLWLVERLYNMIPSTEKYLKVLPEATHLCIWEKSRHTLYQWTRDFLL